MTRKAEQAAGPVILEAAAEYPPPPGIQGSGDGFARVAGNRFAVEVKRDGLAPLHREVGMDR